MRTTQISAPVVTTRRSFVPAGLALTGTAIMFTSLYLAAGRIYNVAGTVGRGSEQGFAGSAVDWTEWIVDWVRTLGFDGFVLWPMGDHSTQTGLFGNEVIPRVREELADVWGNR